MLVQTETEFRHSIELLREVKGPIAVDTETTPIYPGHIPDLAGVSVFARSQAVGIGFYFPFNHKPLAEGFGEPKNLPIEYLSHLFETIKYHCLLFHNAKFDIGVLDKQGINIFDQEFYCTMVMAAMLNENGNWKSDSSLVDVARQYKLQFDQQDKIKQFSKKVDGDFSRIPVEIIAPYAVEDVRLTYDLFPLLKRDLAEQEMIKLVSREMTFLRTLYRMERRGTPIDLDACAKHAVAAKLRLKEIRAELGFDPAKRNELARQLFLEPPRGLGLPVAARSKLGNSDFPTGVPSAKREFVEPYDHLPTVASVLEYRGHAKAVSTWFDGFPKMVGPDGRLHPNYRQAGTRTGRLSCAHPNLQQIPRTSEEEREEGVSKALVKELFQTIKGHHLVEFDYSQMELRLASSYAGDPDLLDVFRNNGDMHQLTADKVGISRHDGKTLNFAIQYGAGAEKIANMLGIEPEAARLMIKAYWDGYPGLQKAKMEAAFLADTRGWVRYWTGKRRHFVNGESTHKAFNSIIQGGSGEIVKNSMIKLEIDVPEIQMCNQVHDSIWMYIPVNGFEDICKRVVEVMEWPGDHFQVPFPVDMKVMAYAESS